MVILLNPHLKREGRAFTTSEGLPSAILYEGEWILVESKDFEPFAEGIYEFSRDCFRSGGITYGDDPQECKKLFERNGSYFIDLDGDEFHIPPEKLEGLSLIQACFIEGGYPDMGDLPDSKIWNGVMPKCFAVENRTINGSGVMGVNYKQELVGLEYGDEPEAETLEEDAGYSSSTLGVAAGASLIVGMILGAAIASVLAHQPDVAWSLSVDFASIEA